MPPHMQAIEQRANVDLAVQRPEAADNGASLRRKFGQQSHAKLGSKRWIAALPRQQRGAPRCVLGFFEVRKKSQKVRSRRSRWNVILPRPA